MERWEEPCLQGCVSLPLPHHMQSYLTPNKDLFKLYIVNMKLISTMVTGYICFSWVFIRYSLLKGSVSGRCLKIIIQRGRSSSSNVQELNCSSPILIITVFVWDNYSTLRLDFGKTEACQRALQRTPVVMTEVGRRTLKRLKNFLEEKNGRKTKKQEAWLERLHFHHLRVQPRPLVGKN